MLFFVNPRVNLIQFYLFSANSQQQLPQGAWVKLSLSYMIVLEFYSFSLNF